MAQLPIIMIQIQHAEKTKFLWPCPGSKMRSRSKWKVCCTSTMIVQLIGTKCVQICEAVWAESRTQSTIRLIWHQVCANMWSGLGWFAHTKYHPSYIKYAEKLSFLWPFPESEMWSRSKWKVCCTSTMIVQLIGTKYVQICEAVWAESRTQSTTRLYIKYAEKLSFLWPFPESEMWSRSKWKVCCTSTMIVQLIGIKCVQICEAVWAESRTQSTTRLLHKVCRKTKFFVTFSWIAHTKYHPYLGRTDGRTDGWTDGRTDTRTWILCPPFRAFALRGTIILIFINYTVQITSIFICQTHLVFGKCFAPALGNTQTCWELLWIGLRIWNAFGMNRKFTFCVCLI